MLGKEFMQFTLTVLGIAIKQNIIGKEGGGQRIIPLAHEADDAVTRGG